MWRINRQACSQRVSDERFLAALHVTLIRPPMESYVQL